MLQNCKFEVWTKVSHFSQNCKKWAVIRLSAGGQLLLAVPSSPTAGRLRPRSLAVLLGPARPPLPRNPRTPHGKNFRAAAPHSPQNRPASSSLPTGWTVSVTGVGWQAPGGGNPPKSELSPFSRLRRLASQLVRAAVLLPCPLGLALRVQPTLKLMPARQGQTRYAILCLAALPNLATERGCQNMEYILNLLVSIAANVGGYYIRKWLDGHHHKGR